MIFLVLQSRVLEIEAQSQKDANELAANTDSSVGKLRYQHQTRHYCQFKEDGFCKCGESSLIEERRRA